MSTFANKYLRERAAPQQLKRASLHSVCTVLAWSEHQKQFRPIGYDQ
jgi:hypothetical protein